MTTWSSRLSALTTPWNLSVPAQKSRNGSVALRSISIHTFFRWDVATLFSTRTFSATGTRLTSWYTRSVLKQAFEEELHDVRYQPRCVQTLKWFARREVGRNFAMIMLEQLNRCATVNR